VSGFLDEWEAAVPNLNWLRVPAFATGPERNEVPLLTSLREFNESGFVIPDEIVAACGERGIRLVLPLSNYWDWNGGARQYVDWAASADGKDDFFTDTTVRQWYREYVEFGWRVNRDRNAADLEAQFTKRNEACEAWYEQMEAVDTNGALVWDLRADAEYTLDWYPYAVYPRDQDTVDLVATWSETFAGKPLDPSLDEYTDADGRVDTGSLRRWRLPPSPCVSGCSVSGKPRWNSASPTASSPRTPSRSGTSRDVTAPSRYWGGQSPTAGSTSRHRSAGPSVSPTSTRSRSASPADKTARDGPGVRQRPAVRRASPPRR